MKKIIIVLVSLLLTIQLFAVSGKPRIAILEFEDTTGKFSRQDLSALKKHFSIYFRQQCNNKFIVIIDPDQEELIKKMAEESGRMDRNTAYQLAKNRGVSADKILYTTITRIGKKYSVSSELIDLQREITDIGMAGIEHFDGTPEGLLDALQSVVLQLVRQAEKGYHLYEQAQNAAQREKDAEQEKKAKAEEENSRIAEERRAIASRRELLGSNGRDWSESRYGNWHDAKKYCEDLVYGGYDDWRLPTISELRTLVPYSVCSRTYPYGECPIKDSDTSLYSYKKSKCHCDYGKNKSNPLGDRGRMWSSSICQGNGRVWYIYFGSGSIYSDKNGDAYDKNDFRCTRD